MKTTSDRIEVHPVTGKERYSLEREHDGAWKWADGYGDGGRISLPSVPKNLDDELKLSAHLANMQRVVAAEGLKINLLLGTSCGFGTMRFAVEDLAPAPRFLGTVVKHSREVPIDASRSGAVEHQDRDFLAKEIVTAVRALIKAARN